MTASYISAGLGTLWKFSRSGELLWHRDTQAEEPAEAYWPEQPDGRKPEDTGGQATKVVVDQLTRDVVVLHSHSRVLQDQGQRQGGMWCLRRYNSDGDLLHSWSDRPHGLDKLPDAVDRGKEPMADAPVHLRFLANGNCQIVLRRDTKQYNADGDEVAEDDLAEQPIRVVETYHRLVTLSPIGKVVADEFPLRPIAERIDPTGDPKQVANTAIYKSLADQTYVVHSEKPNTPWWRGAPGEAWYNGLKDERIRTTEMGIAPDGRTAILASGDGYDSNANFIGRLERPPSTEGILHLDIPRFRFGDLDPTVDYSAYPRWAKEVFFYPSDVLAFAGVEIADLTLNLPYFTYGGLFAESTAWTFWSAELRNGWNQRVYDKLVSVWGPPSYTYPQVGSWLGLNPITWFGWNVLQQSQYMLACMRIMFPDDPDSVQMGEYRRDPYQDEWDWAKRCEMYLASTAGGTVFDGVSSLHIQMYRTNFRTVCRRGPNGWLTKPIYPQTLELEWTPEFQKVFETYGITPPDLGQVMADFRSIGGMNTYIASVGAGFGSSNGYVQYMRTHQTERNVSVNLNWLPPNGFLSDNAELGLGPWQGLYGYVRWQWWGFDGLLGGQATPTKISTKYLLVLPPSDAAPSQTPTVSCRLPRPDQDISRYGSQYVDRYPIPDELLHPTAGGFDNLPASLQSLNQTLFAIDPGLGITGCCRIKKPNYTERRWLLLRTDDLSEVTTGRVEDYEVPIVDGRVIPLRDDGIGLAISGGWIYSEKTGKRTWSVAANLKSIDETDSSIYCATPRQTQPAVTFLRHPERTP
jgi:hypothetical protein